MPSLDTYTVEKVRKLLPKKLIAKIFMLNPNVVCINPANLPVTGFIRICRKIRELVTAIQILRQVLKTFSMRSKSI